MADSRCHGCLHFFVDICLLDKNSKSCNSFLKENEIQTDKGTVKGDIYNEIRY